MKDVTIHLLMEGFCFLARRVFCFPWLFCKVPSLSEESISFILLYYCRQAHEKYEVLRIPELFAAKSSQ
jgi:hypothetical protein